MPRLLHYALERDFRNFDRATSAGTGTTVTAVLFWVPATAFLVSTLMTKYFRDLALAVGLSDIPTSRSSHRQPTPRSGGVAIVVAANLALTFLWLQGLVTGQLAAALGVGGLTVAAVGLADDSGGVPLNIRLLVHFAAALWAVWALGGLAALRVGTAVVPLGWMGHALAVVAIVWALNLFNFMDGIDGIAASQAIFMMLGGAWLAAAGTQALEVRSMSLVLAAATAGFLLWNWPPAKIFLGDVGSGYLGYGTAVLALDSIRWHDSAIWIWLVLGVVFFADATLTLLRRLLRGASPILAHRDHAYQQLARRWGSHRRVTQALLLFNVLVLGPVAWLAARHPYRASAIAVMTLLVVVLICGAAGSGRPERRGTKGEP